MSEKAIAPVITAPRTIEYIEYELPNIGPRDMLLKMRLCGICGSDIHLYRGEWDPPYPRIQGHELFGEVVEIGEDAAAKHAVDVGDQVNVEILIPCKDCYFCERGNYSRCNAMQIFGLMKCDSPPHFWGGFGSYLYVPYDARVHRFPSDVIPEAAVLTEPIATAVRSCQLSKITIGTSVVVIGPGPIGLVTTATAKAYGANPLILVGTNEGRLALGKEMGADHLIKVTRDTPREEVAEKVREYINEKRMLSEVVLETAGTVSAQKTGLGLLRKTGLLTIVGAIGDNEYVELDTYNEILLGEMRIQGINLSGFGYEAAVDIINSKKYPFEKLVTHKFPIQELGRGFEVTENRIGDPIKVVIQHDLT
jgi:threonine dehydrogenase-like Zn-dependent dehydrogenase